MSSLSWKLAAPNHAFEPDGVAFGVPLARLGATSLRGLRLARRGSTRTLGSMNDRARKLAALALLAFFSILGALVYLFSGLGRWGAFATIFLFIVVNILLWRVDRALRLATKER